MFDPSKSRLKINPDHLAAIVVTIIPVLYFLPSIYQGAVLCPGDGILQNVPLRVLAANIIKAGNLPLWNPYIFSGMPLLGAAQGGILFPLNWFYLALPPATATNVMVVSTYMVAALGAYLYGRCVRMSITGAMVTSVTWSIGGFLISQISHINIVQTAALLPWVLWAIERYVATGSRKLGLIIAVLIAIQVFAGHQQTFAFTSILVVAYVLVMAFEDRSKTRRYLKSLVYIVVGVFLSAVQILPTWELLQHSQRSTASYDFFSSFSMPAVFLKTFLAPFVMGGGDGRLFRAPYIGQAFYIEYVSYAGVLALLLAVLSLLFKADRRTKFWAVVIVIALVLSFGRNLPFSLFKIVYYIPVLNLFRVPARHLMEVHFAIAILSGRGLTTIAASKRGSDVIRRCVFVAIPVVVLTFLTVTLLRPATFRLDREAPVTILRAPELFMPIVIALVSACVLFAFVKGLRGSTLLLLLTLIVDLTLWGQFTGWYPASRYVPREYWTTPESAQLVLEKARSQPAPYRILTTHLAFEPSSAITRASEGYVLWTDPDLYMMYGIQNVAGYDGFGMQRNSQLAGQMKLWGDFADPNATLRGNGRELDLLNTRFVVARHERPLTEEEKSRLGDASSAAVDTFFPKATQKIGDDYFSPNELTLPNIGPGKRFTFHVFPVAINRITLITNLSFAEDIADGTVVAKLQLRTKDYRTLEFPIKAGVDTSDWVHDRPDIKSRIKHKLARVATSYDVRDAEYNYKGHTYLTTIELPGNLEIERGEITLEAKPDSAMFMKIFRMSLVDDSGQKTYPLTREMTTVQSASESKDTERWKLVARGRDVNVYENAHVLPRAWMASEVRVLDEPSMLRVIRTGQLPEGAKWDPLRTVLVEQAPTMSLKSSASEVSFTSYGPNRIELQTSAGADSLLVLSENDYPGWRAYIDGNEASVFRVNYGLRGVVVPSGNHQVSFVYRPLSVIAGAVVSLLTAVALIWYGVRNRS